MGNDDALTLAVTLLTRAPLFDGHNDLAWTIRVDKRRAATSSPTT